jgi:hypothetical protein
MTAKLSTFGTVFGSVITCHFLSTSDAKAGVCPLPQVPVPIAHQDGFHTSPQTKAVIAAAKGEYQ